MDIFAGFEHFDEFFYFCLAALIAGGLDLEINSVFIGGGECGVKTFGFGAGI